jgi:hypothetical protein
MEIKEINILVHEASIKAVQLLHYILMHSKDDMLKERCKEMIDVLHQREILPTVGMRLLTEDGH